MSVGPNRSQGQLYGPAEGVVDVKDPPSEHVVSFYGFTSRHQGDQTHNWLDLHGLNRTHAVRLISAVVCYFRRKQGFFLSTTRAERTLVLLIVGLGAHGGKMLSTGQPLLSKVVQTELLGYSVQFNVDQCTGTISAWM